VGSQEHLVPTIPPLSTYEITTRAALGRCVVVAGYLATYFLLIAVCLHVKEAPLVVVVFVATWTAAVLARVWVLGSITAVDIVFILLLSAFQNVVLGYFVAVLSPFQVKLLLATNFVLPMLWLAMLWLMRPTSVLMKPCSRVSLLIVLYGTIVCASVLHFGINGVATVASIRNLVSPLLFLLIGYLTVWRRPLEAGLMRVIGFVGLIVVAIGILELFIIPDLWQFLNVSELWEKKGLTNLGNSGVPMNWLSAERFGGYHIRRMVSSFADPVNLGTFLFLMFVSGFFLRKPWLSVVAVLGIGLTVSKGGVAGLLIFVTVYAYFRASRLMFVLVSVTMTIMGAAVGYYSFKFGTSSLVLHVLGAWSAVGGITEHPLGVGAGFVGTLANQFVDLGAMKIRESGIGLVIGALGIPGLLMFVWLFGVVLVHATRGWGSSEKVVVGSLLGGIFVNIVFNEVALSPNSSAIYFFVLGQFASSLRPVPHDATVMEWRQR